jgi:hypothetical protein
MNTSFLNREKWLGYLSERDGTYEYRTLRYAAVYDKLLELGLKTGDMIVDVGAGMCDFDRYIRTARGFDGRYVPVDGAIDGVDLNVWVPPISSQFFVAIELLEHLRDPARLMHHLERHATKGVVVTTPYGDPDDIRAMDRTHISPMKCKDFRERGWNMRLTAVFPHRGEKKDTILGWWDA